MARLLKYGNVSEKTIQKTVMQIVRTKPTWEPFVLHIANEGKRTKRFGHELKLMGLRPGAFDILVTMQRHGYPGMWLELKSKFGKLSESQKQFRKDMESQGYYCDVAYSIDAALDVLKWYIEG